MYTHIHTIFQDHDSKSLEGLNEHLLFNFFPTLTTKAKSSKKAPYSIPTTDWSRRVKFVKLTQRECICSGNLTAYLSSFQKEML